MQKQKPNAKQSIAPVRRAIRVGRLIATLRTIITVLVIFVIAIPALASLDNALAPEVQLAHAADGPAALSVISTFEYDGKTRTLYAGSNSGVYKSTDDGLNWRPAGNGLPGMDIQDLLLDHRTGSLYAVVYGAGLFRLGNGAQTWVGVGHDFRGSALLRVEINGQTGTLYAGLVDYGMYVSTDNGNNWGTIGMELSNMIPYDLLTGPQPGEIFVATDTGIYHSIQVTGKWDTLTGQIGPVKALTRDPKTGVIYAGTEQGVLMLTPNQDTYLANLTGLTQPEVQALLFDEQTNTLYAGTTLGIYRSTDGAATWAPASEGLSSTQVNALFQIPYSQVLFAGTDSGIFRSVDGGASWQPATTNPFARHGQALLVNQPDNTLYVGTLGGGVFRSADGGANWQPINTGLRNTVVQALGIDHDTSTLFAGTRDGIYRTPVNAINWTLADPQLAGQEIVQMAVDERRGNVYAVTSMGDVWRSANAGTEWGIVQPLRSVFARTVAVSNYSSAIYVGAYHGGVMTSLDGGYDWWRIPNMQDARDVEALAVDERNGTLYVGGYDGKLYSVTDPATNAAWTKLGDGLPGSIVVMVVDEKTGAVLAAVKEGLYQLWSNESNWRRANNGMSHTSIMALGAHRSDDTLYAGVMGGGVYRSIDNGSHWQPVSSGLTDIDMRNIAADDSSGALLVNTTGRGIYQFDPDQKSWSVANIGLKELSSTVGLADNAAGGIDLATTRGAYETTSTTTGWQPLQEWLSDLPGWFVPLNAYGYVGRLPGGDLLWATRGGGAAWAAASANLGLVNATIRQLPDGQGQVYAVWGAELTSTEPGNGFGRVPLAWLYIRAWMWTTIAPLNLAAPWWWAVVLGVVTLALILWVLNRARLSHTYGVPLVTALFNGRKMAQSARPAALNRSWPRWEHIIQNDLFAYGDVRPVDLIGVPGPLRPYAIRRFADLYGKQQGVTLNGNHLQAKARTQIRQWVDAWQAVRDDLRRDGMLWQHRKHVGELANALASVLGLHALPPKDNDSVRAYATQAATEAASATPKVALLFVADNEALKLTAQNIVNALDGLNVPGAQGLVISLGRPGRNVDVTSQVRIAISELDEAQRARLKVISSDEILHLMSVADPVQALQEL